MERLEIHERIGQLRSDLGLSGQKFADILTEQSGKKYTRSSVNNWETGGYNIKADDILSIAKCFSVSSDWLLGLSDVKTPDADVQAVCEYTGLSDSAVSALHSMSYPDATIGDPDIIHSIDILLTAIYQKIDEGFALADIAEFFTTDFHSIDISINHPGRYDYDNLRNLTASALEHEVLNNISASLKWLKAHYFNKEGE